MSDSYSEPGVFAKAAVDGTVILVVLLTVWWLL